MDRYNVGWEVQKETDLTKKERGKLYKKFVESNCILKFEATFHTLEIENQYANKNALELKPHWPNFLEIKNKMKFDLSKD